MRNDEITVLPISHIRVINPRSRNKKIFAELVENIATIGLKRPITVTKAKRETNDQPYNLLCGQGRLEACIALGEKSIPCRIIDVDNEGAYLISLVENIARRKHSTVELLFGVKCLAERGYNSQDIARKTGLNKSYINGILLLLHQGEERLINAVEKGYLPMSAAISIARAEDQNIQQHLAELYAQKQLNQNSLGKIRNLIHRRKLAGKAAHSGPYIKSTSYRQDTLLRIYKDETERQKMMIKQAEYSEQQFNIILSCLTRLFGNKYFCLLLKSEGLDDLPKDLSDHLARHQRENKNA